MARSLPREALLLEDQPLIALQVEELLLRAGFTNVNVCASFQDAMQWLDKNTPGLAVIETRLGEGSSETVLSALVDRGIPYIIHSVTDVTESDRMQARNECAWICKPSDPAELIEAARKCSNHVGSA